MQRWTLQGKIGVRVHDEGQNASFRWENQNFDQYRIQIHGPLGQGAAELERNRTGISLTADGDIQRATSAEELLTMNLGWSFPVSAMSWWIRGLPDPETPITRQKLNSNGQLSELEQQGWQITYSEYQVVDKLTLPRKMTASREHIRVKLVLKNWKLLATSNSQNYRLATPRPLADANDHADR